MTSHLQSYHYWPIIFLTVIPPAQERSLLRLPVGRQVEMTNRFHLKENDLSGPSEKLTECQIEQVFQWIVHSCFSSLLSTTQKQT